MNAAPAITIVKRAIGPVPADSWSETKYDEAPLGTHFVLKATKSRSIKQLGLYWSVLKEVCDATGAWAIPDHLHSAILMDLGYRSVVQRLDGKKYWVRDSASFAKMTQDEFNDYFTKAVARLNEVTGYDVLAAYEEMRGNTYNDNTNADAPTSCASGQVGSDTPADTEDGGAAPPPPSFHKLKAVSELLAVCRCDGLDQSKKSSLASAKEKWKAVAAPSDLALLKSAFEMSQAVLNGKREYSDVIGNLAQRLNVQPSELEVSDNG